MQDQHTKIRCYFYVLLLNSQKIKENNSCDTMVKKNKILRNKFNKKPRYFENYEILLKEIKDSSKWEDIACHKWENLALLRWWYSPRWPTDLTQSLSLASLAGFLVEIDKPILKSVKIQENQKNQNDLSCQRRAKLEVSLIRTDSKLTTVIKLWCWREVDIQVNAIGFKVLR